jgi:hypothetical protein
VQHYTGDQADLLVRYMFTLTPQEQTALVGKSPAPASGKGAPGGE